MTAIETVDPQRVKIRYTANLKYQYVDDEVFKVERNQLKLLFRCPFCKATRTLHVYLDGSEPDFSSAIGHVLQTYPDKLQILAIEAIKDKCGVLMQEKHREIAVKHYNAPK